MINEKLMVSVCCVTYNHEKYISQTIEGFLNQKINFDIEILIHDDASTDETANIVKKYADIDKRIVPILRTSNLKSTGKAIYPILYKMAKGKYIALCEGDDYWTDPYKLQKQIDFLENNPDYGICFHNVAQLNTFDFSKNIIIPNVISDLDYSLEDYILSNRTATCSIVLKKDYLNAIPNWFNKVPFGDLAVILTVMYNSNKMGRVLKDNMGVYRIHENGMHGSFHKNNKSLIKAYLQHIEFTKIIAKEFLVDKKYRNILFTKMLNTHRILATLYKNDNNKLKSFISNVLKKYYQLKIKFI